MEHIIAAGLSQLGLSGQVPEEVPRQLARYGKLLLEKNQVMNLTAIREEDGVARLHMLDCAALLKFAPFEGKTLIDVGTGAGFPGMPLKILTPTLDVTLLDSLQKRLDWLEETRGALGLEGIRTLHARAEEQACRQGFRDSFDLVTARAVAQLRALCELCLPFAKVGGAFLAMKSVECGPEVEQAREAIRRLGGELERVEEYEIPGAGVRRRLVVIRKTAPTPKGYPRRWAKIQKSPL